jgi:hypothetical protein
MARSFQPGYSITDTARPRRRGLRTWLWASVPVWSLGMLSCVAFFARALSTKRLRDWAVTGGYLVVTVVALAMSTAGENSSNPSATADAVGTMAGGLLILLMGVGAVHTFLLYRRPPLPLGPPANSNMAALVAAQAAVQRRAEARRIAETDPMLARDLKIGRPDLQRDYDDGGLVDVNHVSADVLVRFLEWTRAEAQAVIDARDGMGGFSSTAELGVYTTISPDRVDAVADLLLFRRA